MYEEDRIKLKRFVETYADRILFGSDSILATGIVDEYLVQAFLCHARFINQLRLEDEVLQKVSHQNAERLFQLPTMDGKRRFATRP